jgi:hypothetical protein
VTLLACVFPAVLPLHLDAWHMDDAERQRTWPVTSTRALVDCPVCQFPTQRLHRRHVRTVADLPWGPWRVVLHLHVRTCFCAHGRCPRRLFPERLVPLVAPWARRTPRLVHWLAPGARALGAGRGCDCAVLWAGPSVATPCGGGCVVCPFRLVPHPRDSASTPGPTGHASPMAPCGSTLNGGDRWPSCLIGRPRPAPSGSRPIPVSACSPAIGPEPLRTGPSRDPGCRPLAPAAAPGRSPRPGV